MVKPMMLYRSMNRRALKNKNEQALPVYWRTTRKTGVMSELFMDWLHYCFVP